MAGKWLRLDELVGQKVVIIAADSSCVTIAFDDRMVELRASDEPNYHGGSYAEIEAVEM